MNAVSLDVHELRLQVERVVRPLAATARRKDRIRQELLSHLVAVHQQELDGGASAEEALARALERFGDVGAVRRELQATVPLLERVFLSEFQPLGLERLKRKIVRRLGEPPLRCALRMSLLTFFASLLFCFAFCGIAIVVRASVGRLPRMDSLTKFALPLFGVLFLMHLLFPVLADAMRKAVCAGFARSRSLAKAASCGSVAALAVFGSGFGFLCLMNWSVGADALHGMESAFPWLVAAAAATPFLLALYAMLSARNIRRFDEDPWRFVEIEE